MKKPSSKIREEIARLQDQLKQAETREAERIGRIALKAGIGDIDTDEAALQVAFEDIAARFRGDKRHAKAKKNPGDDSATSETSTALASGAAAGNDSEA
ncbi:TraC family protein [Ensifer sp. T173]|uniref:TraC family protein n=1 Tax=Ensifer canadensis TaxID=555315 RepID=A0AAW4FUR7_9HYPH|nr:conjugal transfer protein TraC [Ensifer canadensis]MBM3095025.1 TraC family protein [Ensifer canadensis]UBI81107.1 TraC family protein [Ensifer canadensis]